MRRHRLEWGSIVGTLAVCVGALVAASGCTRRVRADFPRPPVTASVPAPEEIVPTPSPEAETVVEANEPPSPEVSEVVIEEPEPPKRPPRSAPPPLVAEEPEPEPPSTQLSGSGPSDPELASKLDRAGTLLGSVSVRPLSDRQRSQILAARGFVSQARRALDQGDERRALVLVDKGLILVEDVERASRP